jgi:hypothetical protein
MAAFIQVNEVQNQTGKAGHIAASSKGYIGSTLARVVDANINAGLGVVGGAVAGKSVKAPASAAEVRNNFKGVTIDPEFKNDTSAAAAYLAGQQASVLEEGYIWAQVEGSPAVDALVFCRHTSDGDTNTVLGKFRATSDYPAGGITLTPAAPTASVSNTYSVTLFDGAVTEEYVFTSDATPTVAEIITGLVAKINAGTAFDAVDGTTVLTVTSVTGILEIKVSSNLVQSTPARAERVVGARFTSVFGIDVDGVRVAQIRLPAK